MPTSRVNMDQDESDVQLYVYDLSMGLAAQLSPMFLGKKIDGIWHTGVVVYGKEYFYGGMGIEYCSPGGTVMGSPHQVIKLGRTQIPFQMLQQYLLELSEEYTPEKYDLFNHNCNSFSNELSQFLTSSPIPGHITSLPSEVLETPFGAQIKPILDRFQGISGSDGSHVVGQGGGTITPAPSSSVQTSSNRAKPSSESGGFPEESITMIVSSGFTRSEAIEELKKCNGDVEKAKICLLTKALKF